MYGSSIGITPVKLCWKDLDYSDATIQARMTDLQVLRHSFACFCSLSHLLTLQQCS